MADLVHQLAGEIYVVHCLGLSGFLEVRSEVVPAFDDLVVEEWFVKLLQPGGKLSRVDRPNAVVFGGGEYQRLGIMHVGPELVVGRDGCEECALFGNRNRTIFTDPGGTSWDMLVTQHIQ